MPDAEKIDLPPNRVGGNKLQLLEVLRDAVELAEQLFPGRGRGKAKKQWIIKSINELVNIPGIPEGVEAIIIGFLIDLIVAMLNKERQAQK